jgi:hypothetical protein
MYDQALMASMAQCFRHIFTGPRTALNVLPGKLPGKKSIAEIHDITEVTPENIAYAAVMVCELEASSVLNAHL